MSTKEKAPEFTIRPLNFDAALAEKVKARRKDESLTAIAKALGITTGKAAMAELVATTKRVEPASPAVLARAVAKDRDGGASWGLLAAKYGVTEGTARAAYEAATGKPYSSLDFRKGQG
ncbi:MAG: hypothetical protein QOE65_2993 [Solirubrobacteraceae bacterium]|jgi:hypothetical protein|nr:hypothetical protein [Solirubrobacteraceae bacterium]